MFLSLSFLLCSQHVNWARAFTGGIQELQNYVKKFHTTGLVWNKEVCVYSEYNVFDFACPSMLAAIVYTSSPLRWVDPTMEC